MKEKVFALFLTFVPVLVIAQSAQPVEMESTPPKTRYIKMYNLVSASRTVQIAPPGNYNNYTSLYSVKIWNPTIAVGFSNKRGNLHEIELTSTSVNSMVSRTYSYIAPGNNLMFVHGSHVYETYIAARHEYIFRLVKKPQRKLVPSIGIADMPYYLRYNQIPYTTATYPTKETYLGLRFFVIPRINYSLGKRLFMDLNIPLCLADVNLNNRNEMNPTLPAGLRTVSTANFTALPKYFSARLGIGLRI